MFSFSFERPDAFFVKTEMMGDFMPDRVANGFPYFLFALRLFHNRFQKNGNRLKTAHQRITYTMAAAGPETGTARTNIYAKKN